MILLELFFGFLKAGCCSFGGAYAAIPLIRDVVLSYGWMDDEMLTYMIAVSESTPGSLMVNIATYVGASQAGVLGAAVATFAVVLPAFLIVLAVTAILSRIIENKYVQAALDGIKPCIIGIIFSTGVLMIWKNLFGSVSNGGDYQAILITLILGVIYFGSRRVKEKGISPITLIVLAAVCGVIGYEV